MQFSDKDGWQKSVESNQDGYSACVYRYAERWARLSPSRYW